MSRIFCIVGKSGSGKDTIYHKIMTEKTEDLIPVIPYTTRPRRSNEENGVNYYFVTKEELEQYKSQDQIIELRQYDTIQGIWSYFTVKFTIEEEKDYILITTLEGVQGIIRHYGADKVHVVYMDIDDKERLLRCINREAEQKSPDYLEICRRYIADHEDFSKERLESFQNLHYINSGLKPEECLQQWNVIYQS